MPTSCSPRALGARGPRLAAAALALAVLAGPAAAQTVTVNFAPSCAAGAPCTTLRFGLSTGATALTFTTLGFTATAASGVTFAPVDAGNPAVGSFGAEDALSAQFGAFGGSTALSNGGRSLFINFPNDAGFPFQLDPNTSGYVEVDLASARSAFLPDAFTFTAGFDGGAASSGAVTVAPAAVVPEPATVALVAGGLAALAAAARRRRAA